MLPLEPSSTRRFSGGFQTDSVLQPRASAMNYRINGEFNEEQRINLQLLTELKKGSHE